MLTTDRYSCEIQKELGRSGYWVVRYMNDEKMLWCSTYCFTLWGARWEARRWLAKQLHDPKYMTLETVRP